MCIVKDLLTKEELRHMKRALQILPEDAPVSYEVWAIGYSNNNRKETLLNSFDDASTAVEYAAAVYLSDAITAIVGNNRFNYDTDCVFVEVETVIDDTKGGTINIGTTYKNNLYVLKQIS